MCILPRFRPLPHRCRSVSLTPYKVRVGEHFVRVSTRSMCALFLIFSSLFRRRYSYDAIHNAIAKSRSTLQPGGYSRVRHLLVTRLCPLTWSLQICHRAEDSIRNVLNTGDNLQILLALHHSTDDNINHDADCNTHTIKTTWTFTIRRSVNLLFLLLLLVLIEFPL